MTAACSDTNVVRSHGAGMVCRRKTGLTGSSDVGAPKARVEAVGPPVMDPGGRGDASDATG